MLTFFNMGAGNDQAYAGSGNDTVYGVEGSDIVDGNAGLDLVRGGAHSDNVYGGNGNDTLFGDGGNDYVVGGFGSDRIRGTDVGYAANNGRGQIDQLWGGESAGRNDSDTDVFVFGYRYRNNSGQLYTVQDYQGNGDADYALIKDFRSSSDIILLAGNSSEYTLGNTNITGSNSVAVKFNGDLFCIIENQNSADYSLTNSTQFIYSDTGLT